MKYFYTITLLFVSFFSLAQNFDNTFKPLITAPALVTAMAAQTDGKIIVAGTFKYSGNQTISNVIRLNADGTLDNAFNTGTGANGNVNASGNINYDRYGNVNVIVAQSDGKILVGGIFKSFNSVPKSSLIRLNSDGSMDDTFTEFISKNPYSTGKGTVHGLALQADGKIIVKGYFEMVNGTAHMGIVRLNTDGSLDNTFNASFDLSHGSLSDEPVIVLASGKIITGGTFTSVNNSSYNHIVQLNTDGTIDTSFNPGTGFDGDVYTIVGQAGGKILVGGVFTGYNGTAVNKLVRLNANGTLDTGFPYTISFSTGGNRVTKIALQADGKILVGGTFYQPANKITRLTTAGAIDGTFAVGTGAESPEPCSISGIIVGASNIYIGGDFVTYKGTLRNSLAAVNTSGALVTSIDHKLGVPAMVNATHLQSDGKVVIGGNFTYINGTAQNNISRLNTDGSIDNNFTTGAGFNDYVNAISAQSDGKLIVGGIFTKYNSTSVGQIVRLNVNGTSDTGFAPTLGLAFTRGGVNEMYCYADNKILIAGGFNKVNGVTYNNLARLNSNGTTDATFQNNNFTGYEIVDMDVRASDNAIIATGNINGVKDLALLDANGTAITGFDAKSKISMTPSAVAFAPDGNVLLGGDFSYNGGSTVNVIKLDMNANLDPTFNFKSPYGEVSRLKVIDSKYLIGYGDYYGFKPGKLDVVNDQGLILLTLPSFGTTKVIAKRANEFYVTGNVSNLNVTDAINGVLKFIMPIAPTSGATALQATLQQGKVILNWTYGSSDEIGFEIYRAKSGEAFIKVGISATDITTFTDLAADPQTEYRYIVKATNLNGDSPSSNEITVTTLPDKPRAPRNLALTEVSPIEIKLQWQDVSINETEILVYRYFPSEYNYKVIATLAPNTTAFNDKFLTPGKGYYYYVTMKNSLGESLSSTEYFQLSDPTLGSWSNRNPATGVQRSSTVSFVIGTKAYVGTGSNASGKLKDFWEYDPATDTWTRKADFPGTARLGAVGFAINGKGYIGTGNDGTLVSGVVNFKRDFYQYDPATNTWTQVADYPEDFTSSAGISSGVSFVIGNYAYVGLGNNGVNNPKDFYRYDPVANQWAKMTDFAGTGRTSAVGFAGNGKGYIALGGVSTKYSDIWEYDPSEKTWTKQIDFPSSARSGAVAFVVDNRAYIGTGNAGDLFTEVNKVDFWELDLTNKTWRTIPNFSGAARTGGVAFVINNNAYVGLGVSASTYYDDVKSYLPTVIFVPDKPSNLTGQRVDSEVKLDWTDQSDNETAFVVERSKGNQSSYTRVAALDPNTVSFSDNTVELGNTYYYRVFSVNGYGPSDYSNVVSIVMILPPNAPIITQTSNTTSTISLGWAAVNTASSYRIYRMTIDENGAVVEDYKVIKDTWTGISYNDTGLQPLVYKYKIQAVNSGGASPFSAEKTISLYPPPATPLNFTVTSIDVDKLKLQWSASPKATSYRIYRKIRDEKNNLVEDYKVIEDAWTGTTYTDAGLNLLVYTYKIQAANNIGGVSPFTSEETVSLYVAPPAAPLNFKVTFLAVDKVTVQWSAVATATSYRIYRSVHDADNNEIEADKILKIVEGWTNISYVDEGLGLLKYTYKIQSVNRGGTSTFSEEKTIDMAYITGVEESDDLQLKIYPNPVSDKLIVETKKHGQLINLVNAQGQIVQQHTLNSDVTELNVSNLPSGLYILQTMDGIESMQRKFIKN